MAYEFTENLLPRQCVLHSTTTNYCCNRYCKSFLTKHIVLLNVVESLDSKHKIALIQLLITSLDKSLEIDSTFVTAGATDPWSSLTGILLLVNRHPSITSWLVT